jgi:hypothetical protein
MLYVFSFSLKSNEMLGEFLRVGMRGRYILLQRTSTHLTQMLMLVRLRHQRKRGEHQHGMYCLYQKVSITQKTYTENAVMLSSAVPLGGINGYKHST